MTTIPTGKEIKAWRKSKRITQAKMATLCGAKESTIANWEIGRNSPRGLTMERVVELMTNDSSLVDLSTQEERLLDEAVNLGNYKDKNDFLSNAVLTLIRNGGKLGLLAIVLFHVTQSPRDWSGKALAKTSKTAVAWIASKF
jgi:transcriptional regulator with XRE-family HTH domain